MEIPDWLIKVAPSALSAVLGYFVGGWRERKQHRSRQLGERVKETCGLIDGISDKACKYWANCNAPESRLLGQEIVADLHRATRTRLLCAEFDPRFDFQMFCDLDDEFSELVTGGDFQSANAVPDLEKANKIRKVATNFVICLKKEYDFL